MKKQKQIKKSNKQKKILKDYYNKLNKIMNKITKTYLTSKLIYNIEQIEIGS